MNTCFEAIKDQLQSLAYPWTDKYSPRLVTTGDRLRVVYLAKLKGRSMIKESNILSRHWTEQMFYEQFGLWFEDFQDLDVEPWIIEDHFKDREIIQACQKLADTNVAWCAYVERNKNDLQKDIPNISTGSLYRDLVVTTYNREERKPVLLFEEAIEHLWKESLLKHTGVPFNFCRETKKLEVGTSADLARPNASERWEYICTAVGSYEMEVDLCFGNILDTGDAVYVEIDSNKARSPEYHYGFSSTKASAIKSAFEWLQEYVKTNNLRTHESICRLIGTGKRRAATLFALPRIKRFIATLSDEVTQLAVAEFINVGTESSPEWVFDKVLGTYQPFYGFEEGHQKSIDELVKHFS